MRIVGWLALSGLLAGCVPYAPGPYAQRPSPRPYPGYYAQSYAPPGGYAQPGLIPLPDGAAPLRPARPAARARAATQAVTAAVPAPGLPAPAVTEVAAPVAAGPECRTVTQVGYTDGREVQRQERFCRSAPGREWVRS